MQAKTSKEDGNAMDIEVIDGSFVVQAAQISELLGVLPESVPTLMQSGAITSVCERGVDSDQGTFRLSFYYQTRRARLRIDESGHVLQRSVIDFGAHLRSARSLGSGRPDGGSAAKLHSTDGERTSPLARVNSSKKTGPESRT